MPDPTTTASIAAAIVTGLSAFTLAMLGVDYYSLLWALVGALLALYQAAPMRSKVRMMAFIALSTLIGAAIGTGGSDLASTDSRAVLIVLSLVSGYGAQVLVTALQSAFVKRINKLGGD